MSSLLDYDHNDDPEAVTVVELILYWCHKHWNVPLAEDHTHVCWKHVGHGDNHRCKVCGLETQ